MYLSVILPTFNRADLLREVLSAYCRLQEPQGGWELLLIDNGSQDETRQVVRQFEDRLPLTYIYEGRPGKSHASNTGIERAAGELCLFADDDVLPGFDWLRQYERAAKDNPQFGVFGGPYVLKWPTPPAPWLAESPEVLQSCLMLTDPSWKTGPHEEGFRGGNFAVRRAAFQQGFRFDTTLGANPELPPGEENYLVHKLVRHGYRKWWIAEAAVEHIVRPEQMTKQYMLSRAVRVGRGDYVCSVAAHGVPKLLLGVPRYAVRQWLRAVLVEIPFSYAVGSEVQRFRARWMARYYRGVLKQGWLMHERPETRREPEGAPDFEQGGG